MRALDSISVDYRGEPRRIVVYHGDLTAIPPAEAVDLLVVSAFPGDYFPTPTSLIGALLRAGVNVAALAQYKAEDLREEFGCWLSHDLPDARRLGFGRILCFEPALRGRPEEVVGDIFRCLMPILEGGSPVRSVAMPLIASGDQGVPRETILEPLLTAAVHWLELGLRVDTIKIVERDEGKAEALAARLREFRGRHETPSLTRTSGFDYDVFLSYSRADQESADLLHQGLSLRPERPRVYQDTLEIDPGASWQQDIWDALESCRRIVALYSPTYLGSKVCKEEYAIARLREREKGGVLVPLYVKSATLPAYVRILNYIDCREADSDLLTGALDTVLA